MSEAGRAGAISSEEKGALKDELISGNWTHVADVMRSGGWLVLSLDRL